jgi:hypothetical protein
MQLLICLLLQPFSQNLFWIYLFFPLRRSCSFFIDQRQYDCPRLLSFIGNLLIETRGGYSVCAVILYSMSGLWSSVTPVVVFDTSSHRGSYVVRYLPALCDEIFYDHQKQSWVIHNFIEGEARTIDVTMNDLRLTFLSLCVDNHDDLLWRWIQVSRRHYKFMGTPSTLLSWLAWWHGHWKRRLSFPDINVAFFGSEPACMKEHSLKCTIHYSHVLPVLLSSFCVSVSSPFHAPMINLWRQQ